MLNKRKKEKQKKARTPPSETEDFQFVIQPSLLSIAWLSPLRILLLPEYKSAYWWRSQGCRSIEASLEFSQKDLSDRHAKKIKSIEDNVSRIQATVKKKHIEKTIYLYNQSRRNNLRFEGLLEDNNETWDETEAKVKNFLVEKLDFEPAPEIERAHRTGRTGGQDGNPKPRTVVCKFTSYKAKEAILKKARKIKPKGLNIF